MPLATCASTADQYAATEIRFDVSPITQSYSGYWASRGSRLGCRRRVPLGTNAASSSSNAFVARSPRNGRRRSALVRAQPTHRHPASPRAWLQTVGASRRPLSLELRDDERGGAGIDVQLLEDDEILLSKRCLTREAAEYVAKAFKQDYMRQGWAEVDGVPPGAA